MFDEMSERSIVSWTAMINGYVSFSLEDEALRLLICVEFTWSFLNFSCKTLYLILGGKFMLVL